MVRIVLLLLLACVLIFVSYCVLADATTEKDDPEKHCECIDYDCGCCTQLEVKHVIDSKLCANFSYLPEEYGISATITYNDKAIFNETMSVKNPPPICFVHIDKIQMEICLRLYDLDVQNKCFSGCGEFEVSFMKLLPLKKLEIGCFGQDCKKSPSLLTKIEKIFDDLIGKTKKQDESQPQVVLI